MRYGKSDFQIVHTDPRVKITYDCGPQASPEKRQVWVRQSQAEARATNLAKVQKMRNVVIHMD